MTVDLSRLAELVDDFPRQAVAVVGDFVADEFVGGDIARVSREAPVLILRHRETSVLPGGAANAVANLATLGARVLPFGVVGDDAPGRALLACFRAKGVSIRGVLALKGWPTTTKTRFLAGWTHTTRQQVLRVDREPPGEVPARARDAVVRGARAAVSSGAALLVSDYGCGLVSPQLVRKLAGKLVTLDSRYALLDYADCGVAAATPNEPELEALYHRRIGNDTAMLEQLGARALRQMKLEALLVTRGKDGMALFETRGKPQHIRVHGSEQAVDVTGAGDTVIAVFTLALAAGATHLEAARLANYAGGIVVMKRGTATVTREELQAAIRSDLTGAPPPAK